MSLYAVKNDKGEWWDFEAYDGFWSDDSCECAVTAYQERADSVIKEHGGHVVELTEAPAKVVVPEWFDEWLDAFHGLGPKLRTIAAVGRIAQQGWGSNANVPFLGDRTLDKAVTPTLSVAQLDYVHDNKEELMVAALTGNYTVEKPKRYVLPMPYGADDDDPDYSHYAVVNREYHAGPAWHQGPCVSFNEARERYSVTQSDIDAAPDWVKAIKPVEVTEDEQ